MFEPADRLHSRADRSSCSALLTRFIYDVFMLHKHIIEEESCFFYHSRAEVQTQTSSLWKLGLIMIILHVS